MRQFALQVTLAIFLAAAGCSGDRELQINLSSAESVEITVMLAEQGIDAERIVQPGKDEKYKILVSSGEMDKALKLMRDYRLEYRLPADGKDDCEELTKPAGFAPNTPTISELRLDCAIARDVERVLKALPGVVEARALVRANLKRLPLNLTADAESPGASVVLRYASPSGTLPFGLKEAKEIVARSVPGLNPENVQMETIRVILPGTGALFEQPALSRNVVAQSGLGFRVLEADKKKALRNIILLLLLFCLSGGLIGYSFRAHLAQKRSGKKPARNADGAGSKGLFLESSLREGETGRFGTVRDQKSTNPGRQP